MSWTYAPFSRSVTGPLPPLPAADRDWLEPLLDDERVGRLLAGATGRRLDGCHRLHVRYRPGTELVVLCEVSVAGAFSTLVHLRAVAPSRAMPEGGGAPCVPGLLLPAALPLPGTRAVAHEFPDDQALPGLARLADLADLAAEVADALDLPAPGGGARFNVLRYKPRLRAVLSCDAGAPGAAWRAVARCEDPRAALREAATVAALRTALAADDWLLPPPTVRCIAGGAWSCREWVDGADLGRGLRGDEAVQVAGLAGRALARLQSLPMPRELHDRTADGALRELAPQARALIDAGIDEALAAALDDTMRALGALAAASSSGADRVLTHGDFHPGQLVLRGERGSRLAVLDWERAHLGEAEADLGHFAAQALLLEGRGKADASALVAALRQGYLAGGGPEPPAARTALWTGLALANLAVREPRRLRPDWPARAATLLAACGRALAEVDA